MRKENSANYLLCVKRGGTVWRELNIRGCVGAVEHLILTRSQWDEKSKHKTFRDITVVNLISLLTLAFWPYLNELLSLTFAGAKFALGMLTVYCYSGPEFCHIVGLDLLL